MYTTRKFLVIAKTYPELSSRYGETVCTAAVGEDGKLYRLYPIPFRYLAGKQKFQRYQWIEVPVRKNPDDGRPESYRIDADKLVLGTVIPPTKNEWDQRWDVLFSKGDNVLTSMADLHSAQQSSGRSLTLIHPARIKRVGVMKRDASDARTFHQKLDDLRAQNQAQRSQLNLFEASVPAEMKRLDFVGERVCVEWFSGEDRCGGHEMQILDWEICELARREGIAAAQAKVETLLNLEEYRSAFILGNFHMFPQSFAIIGIWYPKRRPTLFRP